MERTRCLIVEAGTSVALAAEAERALRRHAAFEPRRCDADSEELADIEDGAAVLVAFDAEQPALGAQLCGRIKADKPCATTIALIDQDQCASMVEALSAGASDFIS